MFLEIRHLKNIMFFMFAYQFYIEGVDTIVKMAVDFSITLGFNSNDLIIVILITQFVGFPAAIVLIFSELNRVFVALFFGYRYLHPNFNMGFVNAR